MTINFFRGLTAWSVATICSFQVTPGEAGTRYHLQPISVMGTNDVFVSSVNGDGDVVGTYRDEDGALHGFGLFNGRATVFGDPCGGLCGPVPVAIPTGVVPGGKVVGYYSIGDVSLGFVWRKGEYYPGIKINLGDWAGQPPLLQLDRAGLVAYNSMSDAYSTIYLGQPQGPEQLSALGDLAVATSFSLKGTLAGEMPGSVGNEQVPGIFVLNSSGLRFILPAGAWSASGAVLNDRGDVAGQFIDGGGREGAFIYEGGQYRILTLPSSAENISVMGLNRAGYAAGIFQNRDSGKQEVFLSNGKITHTVSEFNAGDSISVEMNDAGKIVISDRGATASASYWLDCKGSGC